MAIDIPIVNVQTDTFQGWLGRTNQVINALANVVVTIAANTAGAQTTGNGYVVGIFGSNTLVANIIHGGNVAALSNLSISTNATFQANVAVTGLVSVGNDTVNVFANSTLFKVVNSTANVVISPTDIKIGNATVNSSANSLLIQVANSTVTANHGPGSFVVGTSTVNATVVAAGANVILSTADLKIGNATINVVANSSLVKVANSSGIANLNPGQLVIGTSVVNTTALAIGANVFLSTSDLKLGNSSVNLYANSSHVVIGANLQINTTTFQIGNSLVNVVANSSSIRLSGSPVIAATIRDSVAYSNTLIGTRSRINFIPGDMMALDVTEDVVGDQINVVITSTGIGFDDVPAATPGGANTHIQYNDSLSFNGSAAFTFNKTTNNVVLANSLTVNTVSISQSIAMTGIAAAFVTSDGPDIVDSFALATYRTATYTYSLRNDSANGYQVGQLTILNNGTTGLLQEYGMMYSNALLGSFSSSQNSTHILVHFTPAATLTYTVKVARTLIPV